ncbi:MAG: response regulator [Bacteroidota bacterium]|nr:response regulator [Bacteroidota bacterium]
MNQAPILIVDDDTDDHFFLQSAWERLDFKNRLIFFVSGEELLIYLKKEKVIPFLILCDVNLPKMSGFELKEKLLKDDELNYPSIPFVFWSSIASQEQIKKSYDLGGNGFFIKGSSLEEIQQSLLNIVNYWIKSKTPF